MSTVKNKKRTVDVTPIGVAHINASFNNIIITITNLKGDTVAWSSSGKFEIKNTKKKTAVFAAQLVTEDCCKLIIGYGVKSLHLRIKGPGVGRETIIKTFMSSGLNIIDIVDLTAIPHGGCRARKLRRN